MAVNASPIQTPGTGRAQFVGAAALTATLALSFAAALTPAGPRHLQPAATDRSAGGLAGGRAAISVVHGATPAGGLVVASDDYPNTPPPARGT